MIGGCAGKILTVDLDKRRFTAWEPGEETYLDYIGGSGVGVRALYERQRPMADPLGHESMLGVLTGPLAGSGIVGGTRFSAVGKSPLTGTWGESSCGGFFGPALKTSGYDGVMLEGKADQPVYVLLDDGRAEIRDAADLWGLDSYETEDVLKRLYGEACQVVCIGRAGERLSKISGLIHAKGRAAGRCGLGAVMGSKKVKAIVARGSLSTPIAHPERFKELRSKYLGQIRNGVGSSNFYRTTGTPAHIEPAVIMGDSPIKNWGGTGRSDFSAAGDLGYGRLIGYRSKKQACWRCPIACWGTVKVEEGPFKIAESHQPEYETLAAFGPNCLLNDLEAVMKCNDICNRSGLDTISAGSVVAFAIECFENGILTLSDTDGLELTWGNAEAIVSLTEMIAEREGIGDVLADGVRIAAATIGSGAEEYAVHVGGQEPGMHDPRLEPSLATIYKMDASPARHTAASQYCPPPGLAEMLGISIPAFGKDQKTFTGRAEAQRVLAAMMDCVNASGICLFAYLSTTAEMLGECLSAVVGERFELTDLVRTGERIENLRHCFNLREGVNPLQNYVSGRVVGSPPLPDGPTQGVTLDIDLMVKEYLDVMGWDNVTARPSREKLQELGLGFVIPDLYLP
jgi:aldehyde:ferredoxin oxidoreductase